jgi:hypothetical protein
MRPDDGEVAHASHGVIFREISRRSNFPDRKRS